MSVDSTPQAPIAAVQLKPATDWIRLAFDAVLAVVLAVALVATRDPDAPPRPGPPPAPPVQPAPIDPPRPVTPPTPVAPPRPVTPDDTDTGPDGGEPDIQAPAAPLAAAAAKFHRSRPKAIADLAAMVQSGEVANIGAAVDFLRGHQKPFADALDAAFDAACDDEGKIVQPKALANQLRQAAAAMGAK